MSLTSLSAAAKIWLLMVLLAMGPFILKTGLDQESIQRQGVAEIYRNMQFQSALKTWPVSSPVIFEQQHEKSILEDAFKINLQKNFKLSELEEAPRIRVFFDSSTFMNAQVDVQMPDQKDSWQSWQGSARLINNGIFFGFWLGVILYLLHHNLAWSLAVSLGVTALWKADWNFLEIPSSYLREFSFFARELLSRLQTGNWQVTEIARLLEMIGAGVFLLGLIVLPLLRLFKRVDSMKVVLFVSLLFEPLFLYLATKATNWGPELSWWKIYLGSFVYRFLLFGHVFFSFLKRDYLGWEHSANPRVYRSLSTRYALLALPLLFVFSGGWSWVLSVFSFGSSSALLKLKIFFASALMAFFLGSRVMTLVVASLAFSVIFPPTEGHWAASLTWALLMDGILLGWFLTPFKGYALRMSINEPRAQFFVVTIMTWVLGIFLSSVGAPATISWATMIVVLWGYAELIRSQSAADRAAAGALGSGVEDAG